MEKCSSCRAPHHVCAVFRCLFWVVSSSGFHGDGRKREEDGSCLPPPEGFQSFFKGRRAGSGSTLLIRQRDHDGPGVAHSAPRISLPQLPWRSGGTALTANGGFPTAPQRKALTREEGGGHVGDKALWLLERKGNQLKILSLTDEGLRDWRRFVSQSPPPSWTDNLERPGFPTFFVLLVIADTSSCLAFLMLLSTFSNLDLLNH